MPLQCVLTRVSSRNLNKSLTLFYCRKKDVYRLVNYLYFFTL